MSWKTQVMQHLADDGSPAGTFVMCATNDETGRFVLGCVHEHPTDTEAIECPNAVRYLRDVMSAAPPGA